METERQSSASQPRQKHSYSKPKQKRWNVRKTVKVFLLVVACIISLWGGRSLIPAWNEIEGWIRVSIANPAIDKAKGETRVHFISVGQGDAVLIEQGEHFALIDAGPAEYADSLVGYLERVQVQQLDLMVMTHPESDHIGGMPAVLEHFSVNELWIPDFADGEEPRYGIYRTIMEQAAEQGTWVTVPVCGSPFPLGKGEITLVSNGISSGDGYNNLSLCLRFDCDHFSFLDTGDAEMAGEEKLLEEGWPLQADIFKVGHHGAKNANSWELLEAVQPRIAVVSCGADNPYGHPEPEVVERLKQAGAVVFRTDQNGNVVVVLENDGQIQAYTQW